MEEKGDVNEGGGVGIELDARHKNKNHDCSSINFVPDINIEEGSFYFIFVKNHPILLKVRFF